MTTPVFSRPQFLFCTVAAALGGLLLGVASDQFFTEHGINTAFVGLIGTVIGGAIGFGGAFGVDSWRGARELAALKASVYAEVSDRAARCINDYLDPWKDLPLNIKDPETIRADRVQRFRPTEPVVFPGVAGRLGLLEREALFAVTQFYFRLAAFSHAVESVVYEKRVDSTWDESNDKERAKFIRKRLHSCLDPALKALKKLDVPKAEAFDRDVVQVYPHLLKSGLSLRKALKKHKQADPDVQQDDPQ